MLRITGDINLTDGFFDTGIGTGSLITNGKCPFDHISRTENDYWVGNMECVISDISCQRGQKARQFIISPSALEHVRHFDFYGIANNHVMQHGKEAYQSMRSYFEEKGVSYAGTNDRHSYVITHQERRIGIIVFNMRPENFSNQPLYWAMPEYSDIASELQTLSDCDYRIAYVHWGNEFISYPYIDQQHLAHFIIDSGADLVIGTHPHVLQGSETYKGRHIFYSLGNFVFNMPWLPTKYSIIVSIDFKSTPPNVSYDYVRIGNDFFPRPVTVNEVPEALRLEYLDSLVAINEENEKYYRHVFTCCAQYAKTNRIQILKNFLHMKAVDSWGITADFIKRRLL